MPRLLHLAFACVTAFAALATTRASEPAAAALTPEALALYQTIYRDVPLQLEALDAEIALAARAVVVAHARVDSYRPFRSFGRYGATYFADQTAQLDLIAAVNQLRCLERQRDLLWQQRQTAGFELARRLK
jgi:hypothetical protein